MHQEEASAFWKMTSTPCEARDLNVTSHSTVTCEKTAMAVVLGSGKRTVVETQLMKQVQFRAITVRNPGAPGVTPVGSGETAAHPAVP